MLARTRTANIELPCLSGVDLSTFRESDTFPMSMALVDDIRFGEAWLQVGFITQRAKAACCKDVTASTTFVTELYLGKQHRALEPSILEH